MSIIVKSNADFQTYINIYENNAEIDDPLKYQFVRTYRVQTASGVISGQYVVSYINGVKTNCKVSGKKLIAQFVNHGLPPGLLVAEHRWMLPADTPQGYMLVSDDASNAPAYVHQEMVVLQGARGPRGISPRITADKTWEIWDEAQNKYIDTKISIYDVDKDGEQDSKINNNSLAIESIKTEITQKENKWEPLINQSYFNGKEYRWCRVNYIADNEYYASGYQETDTFDVDVSALIAQRDSTGVEVFTITRTIGVNPVNPADNKYVRFNIIVSPAYMVSVQLNTPNGNVFQTNIYLKRK